MTDSKINLCYPCGFFRPADREDPIAGEFECRDGAVWPNTARVFWDKLKALETDAVCSSSGATLAGDGSIQVASLNEHWLIDPKRETVLKSSPENAETWAEWDRQIPFLLLVYLASAQNRPVGYDMVLPRDLFRGLDLFRNSLDMDMRGIEKAFGHDGEGFLNAATRLGGEPILGGDVAVRFHVFPKFPVDYILWLGDEEFSAKLTLLVDRNSPRHLSGDGIGVAVSLLSRRLCRHADGSPAAAD